jgi:hypothetical protein
MVRILSSGRCWAHQIGVALVFFPAIHWENGVNDMLAKGAFGLMAGICYLSHRTILIPMLAQVVADLVLLG